MPNPKWFTTSEKVVNKFMADTYGKPKEVQRIVQGEVAVIWYWVKKNKPYKVTRDKTIIITIDSGMVITVFEDVNRFAASEY